MSEQKSPRRGCLNCGLKPVEFSNLLCDECAVSIGGSSGSLGQAVRRVENGHTPGCTISVTSEGDRCCDCGLEDAWMELFTAFTAYPLESE